MHSKKIIDDAWNTEGILAKAVEQLIITVDSESMTQVITTVKSVVFRLRLLTEKIKQHSDNTSVIPVEKAG